MNCLLSKYPEIGGKSGKKFLHQLDLTVNNRYHGRNRSEKAIDALCEARQSNCEEQYPPQDPAGYKCIWDLGKLGFGAMPEIMNHLSDERLTRSVQRGDPEIFATVGDLCVSIAAQFSDPKIEGLPKSDRIPALQSWWKSASVEPDPVRFAHAVQHLDKYGARSDLPVMWASVNRPDLLLSSCRSAIEKPDGAGVGGYFDSIRAANLPRRALFDLVILGANSKDSLVCMQCLDTLFDLDTKRFDKELAAALPRMPAKSTVRACASPEASLGFLVADSNSDEVWRALVDAARRATISLRLEIIDHVALKRDPRASNARRLKFLTSFFADTSVSTDSREIELQDLPVVRVQDLAALMAGKILGVHEYPVESDTRSAWDAYRAEIRERLKMGLGSDAIARPASRKSR